ncbi:MAG: hypothetical protein LBR17_05380 [Bacteroidales bacterium]|jgi:lysozyme|nr:hypothetical protein [Bacteroidales bacterium]
MIRKHRKNRIIRWFFIGIVLIVVGYVLYTYGISYYRNYYSCGGARLNDNNYPVKGLDVSAHQGNINWKTVADSDIRFVFIKATEGINFSDTSFTNNCNAARKEGILVGAYHFFRFNREGKAQAEWFFSKVKPEMIDFPPIIDVEIAYGNLFSLFKRDKIRSEIFIFLRHIEKFYHKKPIIYTNNKTYDEYIKGNFEDYDLWICKLCGEPTQKDWIFWQYTHNGSIAGVDNEVDLNTFNGDYNSFIDYITK